MSAARLCVPCDALWRSVALREASLAGLDKKWLIKMLSLDILRRWVSGGVPGQPQLATCFPPNVTEPEGGTDNVQRRDISAGANLPKKRRGPLDFCKIFASAMQFPDCDEI